MQIGAPNEHGVINATRREVVASYGRAYAAVRLALCEDGSYRSAVELTYSYGGFSSPIFASSTAYATEAAAFDAALEELLRRWPEAWPSEPQSVHEELDDLRRQIETRLQQPCMI